MNRIEKGILAIAISLAMLAIAAGSASANCIGDVGGTVFGCGDTVFESCTLDGDMNCPAGSAGLIIGKGGIVINGYNSTQDEYFKIAGGVTVADCDGHDEHNPCDKSGIYNAGYDDVVIKNLEIENFCTGIALKGTGENKVGNITVDNCSIHDNGFSTGGVMTTHGIHACSLGEGTEDEPALTITNCDIYNNEGTGEGCGSGGNGIFIYAGSPDAKHEYCNISHNQLHHNAKSGFWTKMMLTRSNITNNRVWGNGGGSGIGDDVRGGIILRCKKSGDNIIANNTVYDNYPYGYGLYIGGRGNFIKNNTVTNNSKHGISMYRSDGSFDNELYENFVCYNGEYDIYAFAPESNTTGDDNTCKNCKDYQDTSAVPPNCCVFQCPGEGPDLKVSELEVSWVVPEVNYTMNYTVCNIGDEKANASATNIYIDDVHKITDDVGELGDGDCYTSPGFGPFSLSGINDAIELFADANHNVSETDEDNNDRKRVFGGSDLKMTQLDEVWLDCSWKTYNLTYTVENVGDRATENDVWTNFTEIWGEWSGCVDPVPIPAGLAVGENVTHEVGPFVMDGDADWLQAWVNFNHTETTNTWGCVYFGATHHDCTRFCPGYRDAKNCPGGPCKDCGDVNYDDAVDYVDGLKAYNGDFTCGWAADVNCDDAVDYVDGLKIYNSNLNCCGGGCTY